ncbi:MAG: response regulator, partial [Rhodothermales bacterium]
MRILIIEDDESVRGMVARMLRAEGYDPIEAGDGRAGLEIIENQATVDLVISDILMPVMEGLETLRYIRAHYPEMRIIAMSGGGQFGPEYCLDLARRLGA